MTQIDFIQKVNAATKRDYIGRVLEADKSEIATIAKRFDVDYWDGDRKTGYGGYKYDGRWRPIAEEMAKHYGLKSGMRILDVGCGKGFLLYEFTQVVPGIEIVGLDISKYGIENSKEEVRADLQVGDAKSLPFKDNSYDFVVSLGTLHNLYLPDLVEALKEIKRVSKESNNYVMVESYRNEREKMNLLYWQLTCESFFTPHEWEWVFNLAQYQGDHGYIYFE